MNKYHYFIYDEDGDCIEDGGCDSEKDVILLGKIRAKELGQKSFTFGAEVSIDLEKYICAERILEDIIERVQEDYDPYSDNWADNFKPTPEQKRQLESMVEMWINSVCPPKNYLFGHIQNPKEYHIKEELQ